MPSGPPTAFAVSPSLQAYQISPTAYLERHKSSIQRLVAAGIVMHGNRVLLVQRSAHEFLGLRWEVPGGQCEATDETITAAACRELWEEAGLRAVAVVDVVEAHQDWVDGDATWRKITFAVEVEADAVGEVRVKLDPNEHEDFVWASETEVRESRCGEKVLSWTCEEQRRTVLNAFKLFQSRAASANGPIRLASARDA
ncbi:NUDIX hydrolase domain-like protein [Xylariaceae sp. FL0662B]|nr:NUDIX hydrolase domain-like protein [Xylariaceae sp. FL0662B]